MEYFIVFVLVLMSAFFSGLTLGFFSLNKDDLERKASLGDKLAKEVFEVRRKGNLLLCTLLIGNVAVNAVLSVFLGSIAPGVIAATLATVLIVIFGEIIPQASFSHFALPLVQKFVWPTKLIMYLLSPICFPLSLLLDKLLGEEISTIYSKKELAKIIEEHEHSKESDIDKEEERIIKGALSFSDKRVKDVMTPRTEMYALAHDRIMTQEIINEISATGHSRIPVYRGDKDEIVGILFVKDLIKVDWRNKKVAEIAVKKVIFVDVNKRLDDVLEEFKKTKRHLFIVLNEFGGVSGIVTIEDVIEEIIGEEIVDEYDREEDIRKTAKKKMEKKDIVKV